MEGVGFAQREVVGAAHFAALLLARSEERVLEPVCVESE